MATVLDAVMAGHQAALSRFDAGSVLADPVDGGDGGRASAWHAIACLFQDRHARQLPAVPRACRWCCGGSSARSPQDACVCVHLGRGHDPLGAACRSRSMPPASSLRNLMVLAHNVVVVAGGVCWLLRIAWPGADVPCWRLPGSTLAVAGRWARDRAMLLGAFCARFRDIPPIVGSVDADGVLRHSA